MSQHLFPATTPTGRAVQVLVGYDRPLNGFFLVVTDTVPDTTTLVRDDLREDSDDDAGDFADGIVYSNLDDVDLLDLGGLTLDLDYFKAKLVSMGIALPASIEGELQEDRRHRAGNKVRCYDAAGVVQPSREV